MTKILSIDYGLKRVGLASTEVSDSIAFPLNPIINKNKKDLIFKLKELINSNNFEEVVIGVPLGYDQKETQMSGNIREFAEELKNELNSEIKIIFWNEVLTSKMAKGSMKKFGMTNSIDSESARIILQEYLDHKNETNGK